MMMKKFFWVALFSALFSFSSSGFAQAVDTNSPDGMIKTVTEFSGSTSTFTGADIAEPLLT